MISIKTYFHYRIGRHDTLTGFRQVSNLRDHPFPVGIKPVRLSEDRQLSSTEQINSLSTVLRAIHGLP